jgi:hypothetical protein
VPLSKLPAPSEWENLVISGADLPPWVVSQVARAGLLDATRGVEWVQRIALSHALPDITRAYFAKAVREHATPRMVTVLADIVTTSESGWARLGACEALQGPWATAAVSALESALDDPLVLGDMDFGYRVADEAARALVACGVAHGSDAFSAWRRRTTAELQSHELFRAELAAIVLSRLGDAHARKRLASFAEHSDQARTVIESLTTEA